MGKIYSKTYNADIALKQIAFRDGISVDSVKKNIQIAIISGLCSSDPRVQEYWRGIPCKGQRPTPEELIVFLANETNEIFPIIT